MHIDGATLIALTVAAPWAMLVAVVDIHRMRIPLHLQLGGLAVAAISVGCSALAGTPGDTVLPSAAGALWLTTLYFVFRVLAPRHLGGGDLRIAPAVGALGGLGGFDGIVLVSIGPFAVTAVIGIFLHSTTGARHVPHGPAMVVCAVLAVARGG